MDKRTIYVKGCVDDKEFIEELAQGIHILSGYLFRELDGNAKRLEGDRELIDSAWEVLRELWDANIEPCLTEEDDAE